VPAAAGARSVKLGGYRAGSELTAKAREVGQEANKRKAAERAADLAPMIAEPQAAGATSLRAIAAALDERGISHGSRRRRLVSGSSGAGFHARPFRGKGGRVRRKRRRDK
jgi:hypothetical protein